MRKRLLTLTLLLFSFWGAATAQIEYSFSATAPTGQTLYYYIIDSAQVVIGPPNINSIYSHINNLFFGEFSTPLGWNGYSAPSGNLTIPATVTYNDTTYTVMGVEMAFMFCDSITSISMPNTITYLGPLAFFGCSGLSSISIPSSVSQIAYNNYPSFGRCSRLTSISVSTDNPVYDSRNNCNAIIETSSNNLILGCGSTIIPNTVTSIASMSFFMCDSLTSITIPDSITYIGEAAFAGCGNLTSISVSSGNPMYDSRDKCNAIIVIALR